MKVIVIGGGQVGSFIGRILLENDAQVCIVENRERMLSKLHEEFADENIINGSGTDPQILEAVDIDQADAVVVVTGKDEVNLVAATIAKFEYGVERVIARINNPRNAWLFSDLMGVDVAVNQAELLTHIVIDEIDMASLATLLKINRGKQNLVQIGISANSHLKNKKVKDIDLPDSTRLISILRGNENFLVNGDTILRENDVVLAITDEDSQYQLKELVDD